MSTAPASDGVAARGIGDILLAHGFVTAEELVTAAAEQERTKQPLGQILVQNGSITRLELASALAEQWSDPSASITVLPRSPAAPPTQSPSHDDAQYAARLQEAVADLARRVHATEPVGGFEERLTDLGQRVESTHARTQRLEAAVATLVESLEGVTGGVEDAFTALQAGAAELAADLARIDLAVQELAVRPPSAEPDQRVDERLTELQEAVAALDGHPAALDEVRATLEQLAGRLDSAAETRDVDELRAAVTALDGRPDASEALEPRLAHLESLADGKAERADLEASAAVLAELAETLAELQSRPAGSPDVDERLARLESRLEDAVAAAAGNGAVETLTARFERAVEAQHELGASVAEIGLRVEELPVPGPQLDELRSKLETLEHRFGDGLGSIHERLDQRDAQLAFDLEALRAELSTALTEQQRDHTLDETLAALASRVDELATRVDDSHRAAVRLDELSGTLADVQAQVGTLADQPWDRGIDEAVAALSSRIDDLATRVREDDGTSERIDGLDHAVADIRNQIGTLMDPRSQESVEATLRTLTGRIDEIAALVDEDDGVAGRLDELSESFTQLQTRFVSLAEEHGDSRHADEALSALARRVDEIAAVGLAAPVGTDGRIEELGQAVTELGAQLAMLAEQPRDEHVHESIRSLTSRIDELASTPSEGAAVSERLAEIERRRATDAETIDVLLLALDRIREDLSERERTRPEQTGDPDGRLDELGRSLVEVQERLASLDRPADTNLEEQLTGLAERVDTIAAATHPALEADPRIDVLVRSLAELRDELSTVAAQPRDHAADEALAALAARIDEIAAIPPPPPPEADPRIDVLARSVAELRDELSAIAVQPRDHAADEALAALAARIDEIAATSPTSLESDPRIDELGRAIAELRSQIEFVTEQPREHAADEILASLSNRVDELASVPQAVDDERRREIETLAERLETLSRDLDTRLAAVGDRGETDGFDATVQDHLERVQLSIERFGLHLGEHDRALADLMRSRGVERRVEELAERVDQLVSARPAVPAGASGAAEPGVSADMLALARRVEEAEAASQADREKLMSRLEKLGSAIDWRLQRLEADDTE